MFELATAPTTDALLALARRHAAALYGPPDVLFVHGQGSYLHDADGKAYLDWAGGMGVNFLGHRHPRVVAAVAAQAERLWHTSNAVLTGPPVRLAAQLAEIAHGKQSFFVNAGTEAIEGALKLARRYHHQRGRPRHRFVAFAGGFHGRTLGALSVTGQPKMHAGFAPLLADVDFVPYGDLAAAQAVINDDTAAVLVEPLQGNGGVRVPPAAFLAGLRETTRRHGALLICDEVQTGLGRCGSWLLADRSDVVPDIVCLAKALGGGLPLGAVLADPDVMACFGYGSHGSTFGGNLLACAAATASLETIADEGLLARADALGAALAPQLRALPYVAEVRGRGLLWGVCAPELDVVALREACLREGLLTTLAGTDVVRLFVPAISDERELELGALRLGRALRHVADGR